MIRRGAADALPAVRGTGLALVAALLFGLATPAIQRVGAGLGSFTTASLLYLGAAAAGVSFVKRADREAPLRRSDLPRLVLTAILGAAIGPVALAWGLQHTDGTAASLLLTFEAAATAVLAWIVYREPIDRRIAGAIVAIGVGGGLLLLDQATVGRASLAGMSAIGLATLAWAADNTVSRALAERDPGQTVAVKSTIGAALTLVLARVAFAEPLPPLVPALGLVAIGAFGYGLSLRAYLLAQRSIGAARTGSVFAFAPFAGASAALALGQRAGGWPTALGAGSMALGVLLHLSERHAHAHLHLALDHEHAHAHDDGHHDHRHDPMPRGMHSHPHPHRRVRHAHPHAPDEHHRHPH